MSGMPTNKGKCLQKSPDMPLCWVLAIVPKPDDAVAFVTIVTANIWRELSALCFPD